MADFHKAFEAIDEDSSGEITVDELQHYMIKNNYKESFVSKWLTLFDSNKSGKITYKHYCDTLGLVPREREIPVVKTAVKQIDEEMIEPVTLGNETAETNAHQKKPESKRKIPQSYPVQSQKKVSKNRKKPFSKHKKHLRVRIQAGVVLILLSGAHRGKRVIFLKQLSSGLLLVTGPYKLNGCPIRRVHQNMVIATSTKLNIDQLEIPDYLKDDYFAREAQQDEKKINSDVNNIFAKSKKNYVVKEKRKEDQKNIDSQILKAIKKRDDKSTFSRYLRTSFSLSSHDYPHKMQF